MGGGSRYVTGEAASQPESGGGHKIEVVKFKDPPWLNVEAGNEPLVQDLTKVLNAPKYLVSHLVASRATRERDELARLIKHLPMVKNSRGGGTPRLDEESSASVGSRACTPLREAFVAAVPLSARERSSATTPRSTTPRHYPSITPQLPSGLTSRPASRSGARSGTPLSWAAPRSSTPMIPARCSTPASVTPRSGGSGASSEATFSEIPFNMPPSFNTAVASSQGPAEEVGAPPQQLRDQKEFYAGPRPAAAYYEQKDRERAHFQELTDRRVTEYLAHIGVDPEEATATEILQKYYTRSCGTSYWQMNREADKLLKQVDAAKEPKQLPRGFAGVLTNQAKLEVEACRNAPVTDVHNHFDQWEIGFLADACRGMRGFKEQAKGPRSEYKRRYNGRTKAEIDGGRPGRWET